MLFLLKSEICEPSECPSAGGHGMQDGHGCIHPSRLTLVPFVWDDVLDVDKGWNVWDQGGRSFRFTSGLGSL